MPLDALRYKVAGGPIELILTSRHMQPAVFDVQLWTAGVKQPQELGGGVLVNGMPTTFDLPVPNDPYHEKYLRVVVTVSLLNGKRYAPKLTVMQDGAIIGEDEVDKTTTRNSIGIQFLFQMRGS